jgi:hypothetical protein
MYQAHFTCGGFCYRRAVFGPIPIVAIENIVFDTELESQFFAHDY